MRRKVAFVLLLALLMPAITPTMAATPKAGAKCSKVGATTIAAGKKFTCIKTGSKTVWNKGVAIKKPTPTKPTAIGDPIGAVGGTPTATPTPTPTPTPSPTPTPKALSDTPGTGPAGRFQYRYTDGVMQRINIDGIWRSDDSRPSTDFDLIRKSAFDSIRSISNSNPNYSFVIKNNIAENYPTELATHIQTAIQDFNKVMSQYLTSTVNVDLILLTEKDDRFFREDLPKLLSYGNYAFVADNLKGYTNQESFYNRSGTGGGTAGFIDSENRGYYLGHTASFAKMETFWPEIAPHEMAHVLQFYLARGYTNNCGEGQECSKLHGHFIEGSANTLGMAIAFPILPWYSDEMDKILKNAIRGYKSQISVKNKEDVISLFKLIESRNTEMSAELSYSAGQVLWEYFIGTYGFKKWIEFNINIPKTSNFSENLKYTVGVDKQGFYEAAAPYFLSVWDRLAKDA